MAKFMDFGIEENDAKTFTVAGFKFPRSQSFRPEYIKKALTFRPHPRDVIICSYPKCDSKKIDIIVWKLLYPFSILPQKDAITNRYLTPIETHGLKDDIAQRKSPRLLKTYLPFHLLPFYKRAKYIYIVRSPWDACVSYYRLLRMNKNFTDSFDEYFKSFLEGDLGYGCYFRHVLSWTKKLEENNVLILCHEHVKHNPRSAISTVAAFLGDCHLKQLLHSDDLQTDILKSLNWEKFRSPKKCFMNSTDLQGTSSRLFCSEKQVQDLVNKIAKEIKGTCIEHLWLNLLKKREFVIND